MQIDVLNDTRRAGCRDPVIKLTPPFVGIFTPFHPSGFHSLHKSLILLIDTPKNSKKKKLN